MLSVDVLQDKLNKTETSKHFPPSSLILNVRYKITDKNMYQIFIKCLYHYYLCRIKHSQLIKTHKSVSACIPFRIWLLLYECSSYFCSDKYSTICSSPSRNY